MKQGSGNPLSSWYVCYRDEELYTLMYQATHSGVLVSYVRGAMCHTEEDFFREISSALRFPYYFGHNWNAFDECITDLEWLKFHEILFVIDHFSSMFDGDKKIQQVLLSHLQYAQSQWSDMAIDMTVLLNR